MLDVFLYCIDFFIVKNTCAPSTAYNGVPMYKKIPSGHWCFTGRIVDQRASKANKLRTFFKDHQRKDDLAGGTILRTGHTLTIRNTT